MTNEATLKALAMALHEVYCVPEEHDPMDDWCPYPNGDTRAILEAEPRLMLADPEPCSNPYCGSKHRENEACWDTRRDPEQERLAAIGAAVERLPDDFKWKVDYEPPPNEVAFFVYCYDRYGTGDTLHAAILAALGDKP